MVDLPETDTFEEWLFNTNETLISDGDQSSSSSSSLSLPSSPTQNPSLSNNEEQTQRKKRKLEQKTDSNEHKKSKQTPAYMRKNIRHLFTNDKLQTDTLSALKAEQDRLKRLEEINENYQQFNPTYTHLSMNNQNPFEQISNEQECIVLDDEENKKESLSILKINSGRLIITRC
jgi:hypothetical protein